MTIFGPHQGGAEETILVQLPDSTFTGTTKGEARRHRDAVITNTQPWDEDEKLAITLKWSNRTLWQVRRDGAWKDVCVTKDKGT